MTSSHRSHGNRGPLLSVSDTALQQIQTLMAQRGPQTLGLRLGVKPRGCSGYQYTMEYVDTIHPQDEVVETSAGVTLFIDPQAVMFFIGCEMDFLQDTLNSGFSFKNPNEKGRCGCGESFHV